ncbi:CCB3/YggT - like 1 [Theobroma cacao]|uniref:YlmG homolog protein 1-2, chloroplastic n=1 Tax=Theobroma cacao TaxID=3641 RepID=A0AB32W9P9_THECC|nr:PREDICTED: ylmG homolog protein 1-2, chloroplastic [Theobroma cacao]XP_017974400.1 PREDICTED: ylmG homolog protein 1-2, chloroplastic [Theobroma cacao]WRX10404.1 CCB3/YggT - like 1 [Theobroma cacao]
MSLLSQTLLLRASNYLPPRNPISPIFTSKTNSLALSLPIKPSNPNQKHPKFTLLASVSPSRTIPCRPPQIPAQSRLSDSTRTLKTLFSIALSATIIFTKMVQNFALKTISQNPNAFSTVGPLFFASLKDRPSGYLNTPLTVVAAGLAKWLDIYSGVLMVRVLLSWFPNIPWDRQPLSAIRDLCDPYLNLFRNIIPPIFDTLDVSPLLAFAVLGTLGSILNNSRGMY